MKINFQRPVWQLLLLAGILIVLGVAGSLAIIREDQDKVPIENSQAVEKSNDAAATTEGTISVIDANNQFTFELYPQVAKGQENVFFSPISISMATAMALEGARGKTSEEMRSVFHFPSDDTVRRSSFAALYNRLNDPDAAYQLNIANALWVQQDYPLLKEYLDVVQQYYGGKASNVDFKNALEKTRQTINDWVEDQTKDKIKNLFPKGSLESTTRLVLTNAIYFKGTWMSQFEKDLTKDEKFLLSSGATINVPMMRHKKETALPYAENDETQVIELPYEGDQLSMLVALPKNDDMTKFEKSLSPKKINEWRNDLVKQRVDVFFPKFKFDSKYFLAETLNRMGMPTAFSTAADFSGIDGSKSLSLQKIIHQAIVEVNEEGTEAAAATGISVGLTSLPPQTKVFRADHPFIFFIQDRENGSILFMGRVSNPLQ